MPKLNIASTGETFRFFPGILVSFDHANISSARKLDCIRCLISKNHSRRGQTKRTHGQQIEQSPELSSFDTTIVPHKTRLSSNAGSQRQASLSPGRVPVLTAAKPHSLPASAQLFTAGLPAAAVHAVRPRALTAVASAMQAVLQMIFVFVEDKQSGPVRDIFSPCRLANLTPKSTSATKTANRSSKALNSPHPALLERSLQSQCGPSVCQLSYAAYSAADGALPPGAAELQAPFRSSESPSFDICHHASPLGLASLTPQAAAPVRQCKGSPSRSEPRHHPPPGPSTGTFPEFFQQDGAPPHYGCQVRAFLDEQFPEKWIGRRGPVEWPPRSPDLTPLDFYLWGHLKAIVYGVKIQDVQHLKLRILEACAGISPAVLLSVCEEWEKRVALTIQHNGQHTEHIL
ncbi:Transposable element Tc3 transposase [Labeo rohita]|uniref:Transposable element Tc3 transposase n=1 Tax=Labeo rohita TaxID=84645 RepID=A0ABQ8LRR7_LABRO|nr:Transposable element Tc3 transposase [Labeo rohita]